VQILPRIVLLRGGVKENDIRYNPLVILLLHRDGVTGVCVCVCVCVFVHRIINNNYILLLYVVIILLLLSRRNQSDNVKTSAKGDNTTVFDRFTCPAKPSPSAENAPSPKVFPAENRRRERTPFVRKVSFYFFLS